MIPPLDSHSRRRLGADLPRAAVGQGPHVRRSSGQVERKVNPVRARSGKAFGPAVVVGCVLLAALGAALVPAVADAAVRFVAADGSGDYPTIAAAVAASADGDEIRLGDGTFTGLGNRNVVFAGRDLTIASQSGNRDAVIIDLEGLGRAFVVDGTEGSTVRDLTIRNGYREPTGDNFPGGWGGAVYIDSLGVLDVVNVLFGDNVAQNQGGAIYLGPFGDLRVTDSVFLGNEAGERGVPGGFGGGVRADSLSTLEITGSWFEGCYSEKGGAVYVRGAAAQLSGCTFRSNEADFGAGFYAREAATATLVDCEFSSNIALSRGGGFYATDPGVVATLLDCRFQDNVALGDVLRAGGGALYALAGPVVSVEGCLITGNYAERAGGAFYAEEAEFALDVTTVAGNRAGTSGGAFYGDGQVLLAERTIFWGDCAASGVELYFETGGQANLTCSLVDPGAVVGSVIYAQPVASDPLFCAPLACAEAPAPGGDYTLQEGSPASAGQSPCGLRLGARDEGDCTPPCAPRDYVSPASVPPEVDPARWDDDVLHVVGDWIGGELVHSVYGDAGAIGCPADRVVILDGPDPLVAAELGSAAVAEDGSFPPIALGTPVNPCVFVFTQRDLVWSAGTPVLVDLLYPTIFADAGTPYPDGVFDPWNPDRVYDAGDFVNLRLLALDPAEDCSGASSPAARNPLLHVWADLTALDATVGSVPGFGTPADSIVLVSLGANGVDDDGDWRAFLDLDGDGFWAEGEPLQDDLGLDGIPGTLDEGEGDGVPTFGDSWIDENGNGAFDPGETFLNRVVAGSEDGPVFAFDPGEPNLDSWDLDESGWYELRSSDASRSGTVRQGYPLAAPRNTSGAVTVPLFLSDNGIDGTERPGAVDRVLPFLDAVPDANRSLSHLTILDGSDSERTFAAVVDLAAPGVGSLVALVNEPAPDSDGAPALLPAEDGSYALGRFVDLTVDAAPGDPVLYVRGLLRTGEGTWFDLTFDPSPATGSPADANGDGHPGARAVDDDGDADPDDFDDDEDGQVDEDGEGVDFADRDVHAAAQTAAADAAAPFGNGLHAENDYVDNDNDAFFVFDSYARGEEGGIGRTHWYNVDESRTNGFDDDNDGTVDEADEAPESVGYGSGARDDDEDGIADGEGVLVPIDTPYSQLASALAGAAPVPGPGADAGFLRVDAAHLLGLRPRGGVNARTAPFYANELAYGEVVAGGQGVLTHSRRTFAETGITLAPSADASTATSLGFQDTHGGVNLDLERLVRIHGLADDGLAVHELRLDGYDPAGNERLGWLPPVRFTVDFVAPRVLIPGCAGDGDPPADFVDIDPEAEGIQIWDAGAHPGDYLLTAVPAGPADEDAVSVTFEASSAPDFASIDWSASDTTAPFEALWPGDGMFTLGNDPPDASRPVYFRTRAVDARGNVSSDSAACVLAVEVVDGLAPTATLVQIGVDGDLSDGAEAYLDSTYVLVASLDDGDGESAFTDIASVTFEQDAVGDLPDLGWLPIATLTGSTWDSTVSAPWSTAGLSAGTYRLRSHALDVEGNGGAAGAVEVTVEVAALVQGACCLGDACTVRVEADCLAAGGAFFPDAPCSPSPCVTGACCTGAECALVSEADCADGIFRPGDSCSPNPCALGACCEEELCTLRTRGDCEDLGGSFVLAGSCDPDPCNSGACCQGEVCSLTSARECAEQDGVFLAAEVCDPNPCTLGTCCEDETCTVLTRAACGDRFGDFLAGGTCDPSPCDFGACCLPQGCTVVTEAECAAVGAVFFPDSICDPDPCLTGACCQGAECTLSSEPVCQAGGGTFVAGAACDPSPCVLGACCLGETCEVLSEQACAAGDGVFLEGADCSPNPCVLGACCTPGGCALATRAECADAQGDFLAGATCDPSPCDTGACCVAEECALRSARECADLSGDFLPAGSCDPNPCARGACCLGVDCIVLSRHDCAKEDGVFTEGLGCEPSPCRTGACCVGEICSIVTELACADAGGLFLADLTCEPNPCALGACCRGEECSLLTERDCLALEGDFAAEGSCDPNPCLLLACCLEDDCVRLTAEDCASAGGTTLGDVPCTPSPCRAGACCQGDFCTLTTEAGCAALEGRFFPGAACDPSPCVDGACCTADGCFLGAAAECVGAGEEFFPGEPCTPSPCALGACCLVEACEVATEADCADLGGTFFRDEACDPNPCVTGACCLSDGGCAFRRAAACDDLGGVFFAGQPCDPTPCTVGACCLGSACELRTPAECVRGGGTPSAETSCDPSPCQTGACCLGSECTLRTERACVADSGEFVGGAPCDPSPCQTGACCLESGCALLDEADCASQDGVFFAGAPCDPSPCLTGACCQGPGCTLRSEAACSVQGGVFFAGAVCDPSPCVDGACCQAVACALTSEAACEAEGGVFFADASCDPSPCLIGACCRGQNCTVLSAAVCGAVDGTFFPEAECAPSPCLVGACCLGPACSLSSEAECAQASGEFLPDGVCAPNPCLPSGACCFDDGVCRLLTEPDCADARGLLWDPDGLCDPNPCRPVIGTVEVVEDGGDPYWEVEASPEAEVEEITGWFRRGGEAVYRQVTGFARSGDTWTAVFPEEERGLRGIEFYLDYRVAGESAPRRFGSAETPRRIGFEEDVQVPLPAAYGLRLVSAPGTALVTDVHAQLAALLGPSSSTSWIMASYTPEDGSAGAGAYLYVSPAAPEAWAAGRGYWLGVADRAPDFRFRGATRFPATETGEFVLPLLPGWNLLGNPAAYALTLDPARLRIDDGTSVTSLAERFGGSDDLLWVYDPVADPASPYRLAPTVLAAWEGFWIENPEPRALTLRIPAGEAQPRPGLAPSASPASGLEAQGGDAGATDVAADVALRTLGGRAGRGALWTLAITAETVDERREVLLGVRSAELGPELRRTIPAYPGQLLHLALLAPDGSGGRQREATYRRDFRSDGGASWRLRVTSEGAPVSLAWTMAGDLPALTLEAPALGRRWNLADLQSLDLPAGINDLLVRADDVPSPELPAARLALVVDPNPVSGDAAISFRLPASGEAGVAVYDVLGHRVWQASPRSLQAGAHVVFWNGRDGEGVALAAGTYFVRLEARTAEGQATETRKVVLVR